MTPFGLENIDLRSPKLLTLKFTGVPFHLPNLVTLALIEAEIAGRGRICPPPLSRARDPQTLSSARVKRSVVELRGKAQQIALDEYLLAIGDITFGPRSVFDPVLADQRSNFRKFHDFFQLHESMSVKLSIVSA